MTSLNHISLSRTISNSMNIAAAQPARRKSTITPAAHVNKANRADVSRWSPNTPEVVEGDLQGSEVVILHYWASWNLDDRETDRRLEALRREFGDRISFRSCEIDRAGNARFIYGMANFPALGCFIHGQWNESLIGLRSEAELRSTLSKCLAVAASRPGLKKRKWAAGVLSLVRTLLSRGSAQRLASA